MSECHRIRSGLGDRAACATHSVLWPCQIRALSLTRPWSELVSAGLKTVENRSWQTSWRGWMLIHAAKSWDDAALSLLNELVQDGMIADDEWERLDSCAMNREAPTGYLGIVRVTGCHMARDLLCTELAGHDPADNDGLCSHWSFDGSAHWQLADARRFQPVTAPGALGLFEPPADVIGTLRDLMWEAGARD